MLGVEAVGEPVSSTMSEDVGANVDNSLTESTEPSVEGEGVGENVENSPTEESNFLEPLVGENVENSPSEGEGVGENVENSPSEGEDVGENVFCPQTELMSTIR